MIDILISPVNTALQDIKRSSNRFKDSFNQYQTKKAT